LKIRRKVGGEERRSELTSDDIAALTEIIEESEEKTEKAIRRFK